MKVHICKKMPLLRSLLVLCALVMLLFAKLEIWQQREINPSCNRCGRNYKNVELQLS